MTPRLDTPQLVLTWPTEQQITAYHDAVVGSSVLDTILWEGPDHDRAIHEFWDRQRTLEPKGAVTFAMIERTSERYVGQIALRPEDYDHRVLDVGYVVLPDVHGKGFASEAASAMVDYGFRERAAERIFALIFVGNDASRRVAEKAGMRFEGTRRRSVCKRDVWRDEWQLAITRPDWETAR